MSEEFIETIKEYVEVDDNIKEAEKSVKLLKSRRNELQEAIITYMKSQEWDVCNTSNGNKLSIKTSTTKKAIPQKELQNLMGEYLGDPTKVKDAFEFAQTKRETVEKKVLKRS